MALTVGETLRLPVLAGSEVLAGRLGLDGEIRGVTVVDSPDGLRFLKGGEFILSTLFLWRESASDQLHLLEELHQHGAVALGFKKRFVASVPPALTEGAEEWHMPLIRVPDSVPWVDIINAVLKEWLGKQTQELEQSWRIHRQFIDLALEGRGLKELVDSLAATINRPVVLKETCNGQVFHAGADWSLEGSKPIGEPWVASGDDKVEPLPDQAGSFRILSPGGESSRAVCPIRSGKYSGGTVVVLEGTERLDGWGLIALQQAATVAALEVVKLRALEKMKKSMRDDFLYHLLSGAFESEGSARERAWALGWDLSDAYIAIVFKEVSAPVSWEIDEEDRLAWRVIDLLQTSGLPRQAVVGVDYAEHPILLYPITQKTQEQLNAAELEVSREVERLVATIKRSHSDLDLLAGIGRPRNHLLSLGESYREAVTALKLAPTVPRASPVVRYRELGVYRLVPAAAAPEAKEFVADTIGPLLKYDRENGTELLMTLRTFLENGGNYRKTARALYLHHNTVRYRLSQVEKMCGVDLTLAHDLFQLQLAVSLWLSGRLYA